MKTRRKTSIIVPRGIALTTTLLLVLLFRSYCGGESLEVLRETSYAIGEVDCVYYTICALQLGGDTILSGSEAGIFAQYDSGQPWQKLMDCISSRNITWSEACYKRKKWKQLFSPQKMWRIPETNDIVVLDDYCGCLSTLHIRGNEESYTSMWKKGSERDMFSSVNIQEMYILCGLSVPYEPDHLKMVAMGRTDRSDFSRVLEWPVSLRDQLDSVGIDCPFNFPALNPADSTLWVAVWGYDYIYMADLDGRLTDSLRISAADYCLPQPPKSRIQSLAVWADWMSRWTPITDFWYVPPHYFFLQYRIGWEEYGQEKVPLYSTLVWDTDRQPVELAVDKHWQLAGVQPDGRLIFGRFVIEDDQRRIELYMARIEP